MNEKPGKLPMGLGEALARLAPSLQFGAAFIDANLRRLAHYVT